MNEEITKSIFQEAMRDIHVVIGDLSKKMVAGFAHVDKKFESVDKRLDKMDKRFDGIDKRFDQVDQRFEQVDQQLNEIDQRFTGVDKKFKGIDAQFAEAKEERRSFRDDLADLTIMTKVGFDDLSKKVNDNTKTIASVDTRIHRLTDIVYDHDLRLRLLEKT